MERYDDRCADKGTIEECSNQAMDDSNINSTKINAILNKSFTEYSVDNETVLDNSRLKQNAVEKLKSGIIYEPAIVVNNLLYRGNL